MELNRLAELIKTYSSVHLRDICAALTYLTDEMEHTKAALSADLMSAQNQYDFSRARGILNVQEELSQRISDMHRLLAGCGIEDEREDAEDTTSDDECSTEPEEHSDYSLYDNDKYLFIENLCKEVFEGAIFLDSEISKFYEYLISSADIKLV